MSSATDNVNSLGVPFAALRFQHTSPGDAEEMPLSSSDNKHQTFFGWSSLPVELRLLIYEFYSHTYRTFYIECQCGWQPSAAPSRPDGRRSNLEANRVRRTHELCHIFRECPKRRFTPRDITVQINGDFCTHVWGSRPAAQRSGMVMKGIRALPIMFVSRATHAEACRWIYSQVQSVTIRGDVLYGIETSTRPLRLFLRHIDQHPALFAWARVVRLDVDVDIDGTLHPPTMRRIQPEHVRHHGAVPHIAKALEESTALARIDVSFDSAPLGAADCMSLEDIRRFAPLFRLGVPVHWDLSKLRLNGQEVGIEAEFMRLREEYAVG